MILCCGEAVIDMVQTNVSGLGDVFFPIPGGCSYNTSIAIGRLGVPVAFLGRLSTGFFGEIQLRRLRENNVKDNLLIRCDQNPVLAFIKTEEGKDPQYAFYDEGTADRMFTAEELPPVPAETTCIVFGSISMNMEPVATTVETLIMREAGRNTVIAFDPNIRPFMIDDRDAYLKRFEKWAAVCTIAKISGEDFEFIFPGAEPEDALQKVIDFGVRLAIVTLGASGAAAMLRRDDGSITSVSVPGVHIPVIADTVGAGDTFHGAFLAWLESRNKMSHNAIINLNDADLRAALIFANKAASIVCTRRGAEPPVLGEIEP
ncbi:MAG: carbohydrate kinase [Treponema sp.]|nr:carbohydrate kinase [Treponema sp.]